MKKILIVFGPVSQKHLVSSIIKYSTTENLKIDGFNSNDWSFVNRFNVKQPFIVRLLKPLLSVPKVGNALSKLFFTFVLKRIAYNYDAIDVSFFSNRYYPFLNYLIKKSIPYKITFWGSDFYRANEYEKDKKNYYLKHSKIIQVETKVFKNDVTNQYPFVKDKIQICNYGIDLLDVIDRCKSEGNTLIDSIPENRIVVTCGYNGSFGQQHEKIISMIKKLPDDIKSKIYLFFPITYGLPNIAYKEKLMSEVESLNIPYTFFTKRLSDVELAKLRIQTDIVLNIQVSDALSSSLLEHIYAGSILVCGDWLPYSLFDEKGIKYYKSSLEQIGDLLVNIINNLDSIRNEQINNSSKVSLMSSWSNISSKQKNLFESIFE